MGDEFFLVEFVELIVIESVSELDIAYADIGIVAKVHGGHVLLVKTHAIRGLAVTQDVATRDTLHGAVKGGNGRTIDDDVVVGTPTDRDLFAVEFESVGLGS